jgi:hypothetical protein
MARRPHLELLQEMLQEIRTGCRAVITTAMLCVSALLLAVVPALAQTVEPGWCRPIDRTGPSDMQPAQIQEPVRKLIDVAAETPDASRIAFESPVLASGRLARMTASPLEFIDPKGTCLRGFWSATSGWLDHSEVLRIRYVTRPADGSGGGTRSDKAVEIAFAVPTPPYEPFWKAWRLLEPVELHIAAWDTSERDPRPIFGTVQTVYLSRHNIALFLALLFAGACYLAGALVLPRDHERDETSPPPVRKRPGRLASLRRLLPWCISATGGEASLSQLQMLIFTLIVATLLFYQWLRTSVLDELSPDLLLLIGISTVGAGATKATVTIKRSLDSDVRDYLMRCGWFSAPHLRTAATARLSQLILTDGTFDIYKFQMVVFSVVVALYVIGSGATELGDVRISSTILGLIGISQGTYVGSKIISDQIGPFQDKVKSLMTLEKSYESEAEEKRPAIADYYRAAAQDAAEIFARLYGRLVPERLLVISEHRYLVDGAVGDRPAPRAAPLPATSVSQQPALATEAAE